MTAEKLHDALTLLPGDLIAATDKLRTQPRKAQIHWGRWASMAACLVMILFGGWMVTSGLFSAKSSETVKQAEPCETYAAAECEEALPESNQVGGTGNAAPAEEAKRWGNTPAETADSTSTSMAAVWRNQATTVTLTPGYRDDTAEPRTQLIRSRAELDAYVEENQEYYDFTEFQKSLILYKEDWFEENDLLLIVTGEPYTVSGLHLRNDQMVAQQTGNVWELCFSSEPGDGDLATGNRCRHILLDVRKNVIQEEDLILFIFE